MKKEGCLSEKLQLLEPDENTIISYKEIETKSVEKLRTFLLDGNPLFCKSALQILSKINELRKTMKSQVAIRAQIFRDISEDKKEMKQYIKVSFPHLVKSKKGE
mgnify:CR=1 FL=1